MRVEGFEPSTFAARHNAASAHGGRLDATPEAVVESGLWPESSHRLDGTQDRLASISVPGVFAFISEIRVKPSVFIRVYPWLPFY